MSPAAVVLEEQAGLPVLVIDKDGNLSEGLVLSLAASLKVIFVSSKKITHARVINIAYTRMIPRIPHARFSAIIVASSQQKDLVSFLPELSEKARECHVPLMYITSIYEFTKQAFTTVTKIPNLQLVLVGDVIGLHQSRLDELITEAKIKEKILLPETGLLTHYPTPYQLFVEHVISLAFSPLSAFVYEPICLFSKTPTTEIAFARIIQHALPETKIDFIKKKIPPLQSFIPDPATYLTYTSQVIVDWIKTNYTAPPKHLKVKNHSSSSWVRRLKILVAIICFLFLLPLFISFGAAGYAKVNVSRIEQAFKQGKLSEVYAQSEKTTNALQLAESTVVLYQPLSNMFQKPYQWYTHTLHVGREIIVAVGRLAHAGVQIQQSVKTDRQSGDKAKFVSGVNEAGESLLIVQKLLAQSDLPPSLKTKLQPYQATIEYLSAIRETLPELVGFNGERTYLVLFQNNTELRPGGGFIGSFALIKVDRGELVDSKIYDVYDADGQLQGHIDPPFFLNRYMGASHWYLRDSNASVLFSENGAQALFFLEKEMKVKADGVIAVNAQVIQDVMQQVGQISIPEYKQTITSDNVIELTQDHAEKDFFPGSTQKKDFLNAFQKALITKLTTNTSLLAPLGTLIGTEVKQKNIQTYFSSKNLEEVFVSAGSGGAIPMVSQTAESFSDLFGISEANIGQNKTNRYLQRRIDQQVKVTEKGEVAESITLTYVNTSTKTTPYGGDYVSYLRFIIPKNARVASIQVDGQDQVLTPAITDQAIYTRQNFLPPKELEIETNVTETYQTVGFLLLVPSSNTKKITFSYTQQIASPGPTFTYVRNMVKQSGTKNDPYTLTMLLPDSYIATDNNLENGQQIGNMLQAKGTLKTDTRLMIRLVKKQNIN